jgi:putative DNA primase/helicase
LPDAAGRRTEPGQEVRLLDLPAVVAGAYGCFEQLHGAADGKAFAQMMHQAVIHQHGTAGPAFVKHLALRLMQESDFVGDVLFPRVVDWCRAHVPPSADGHVQRAGQRFGIVAVAGELATEVGITGWPAAAAGVMFRDWLRDRGSTRSRENQHLFAAFRYFLVTHGASRFEPLRDRAEKDDGAQNEPPLPDIPRTIERAG